MNSLARRIRSLPGRAPDLTPARGVVPTPASSTAYALQVHPGSGAGLVPLNYLIASDGAMFPATGPGGWDHLIAAGRIR